MGKRFVVTATGDSLISRRIPAIQERSFTDLVELIRSCDVAFTNMEMVLSDYRGTPVVESGGLNLSAGPGVARDLQALGFNLTDDQMNQLKSCTQLGQQGPPAPGTQPQNPAMATTMNPQQAPLPPGTSSIEQAFQALDSGQPMQQPTSQALTQFGYALFSSPVSTFAPVDNVPVSKDYLVGPGDELKVLIWGRVTDSIDQVVQRDGSFLIPEVGPLQVAGLTFEQAKKLIEDRLGQISGVHSHVTMGQLRTMQVFLLGEVAQPGAYTISALSRSSPGRKSRPRITGMPSVARNASPTNDTAVRVSKPLVPSYASDMAAPLPRPQANTATERTSGSA